MKFYVVCWYDSVDEDLSPCFSSGRSKGDIVVDADLSEIDYVELFRDRADAEVYLQELLDDDGFSDNYHIVEVEV